MPQAAIGPYTYEQFEDKAREFHNYPAPGLMLGGFMVSEAQARMPEGVLFDAVSETSACLPDAVQMLTPCTVGNSWLKVINLGIYAVTLYGKATGDGVRVAVNSKALNDWPEIRSWLMKEKPKAEQDSALLREQIKAAGASICTVEKVHVQLPRVARKGKGAIALCPVCSQPYPAAHGRICRVCRGEAPYETAPGASAAPLPAPNLETVPVEDAVGKTAMHDMTRIVPGESKGPALVNGQVISPGDVCRLHLMGKSSVFVPGEDFDASDWVHEDDAARAFARAMSGEGVSISGDPREGKAGLSADQAGLFLADRQALAAFNMIPGVMCASRHEGLIVEKGAQLAGTRAIPLYLPKEDFGRAMAVLDQGPLFRVLPLRKASVGLLITGTEVHKGLIKDRFRPVVETKVTEFGSEVRDVRIVPDEREAVRQGVEELLGVGCDLLITTAGMSVDPDDVTRTGLLDAGAKDVLYGAPILPGAMTMLARVGDVPVLGVPACALFYKTTSLDLMLPRLLAGAVPDRRDLAEMGHGSMCLECRTCTFPKCPFGR